MCFDLHLDFIQTAQQQEHDIRLVTEYVAWLTPVIFFNSKSS